HRSQHVTALPKKSIPIPSTPANPPALSSNLNAPTSSASSSAGTPVPQSPFKKKPKKKNLFGISGYQRAGDESAASSQRKSDDGLVVDQPESSSSSSMDLFEEPKPNSDPLLKKQQRRTLFSLPLYRVSLLPIPPAPSTAQLLHPKKIFRPLPSATTAPRPISYFIDLQVALYLGKQSGRQVLDLFPNLSSRVATRAQKEKLSASPLSESCFEAIMESRRKQEGSDAKIPRWIQWSETSPGSGKRGLRFEELDVQFLAADEVIKVLKGWKRRTGGGDEKLEDLFREEEDTKMGDGDEDEDEEFSETFDVEEMDLDKYIASTSGRIENKTLFGTGSGSEGVMEAKRVFFGLEPSKAMNHKFKKFGVGPVGGVKSSVPVKVPK
ncbi:UNVERIFIED_CONTAM: hypothetical protein HDU68_010275, partial [Siphonaria sp. JEL0065]